MSSVSYNKGRAERKDASEQTENDNGTANLISKARKNSISSNEPAVSMDSSTSGNQDDYDSDLEDPMPEIVTTRSLVRGSRKRTARSGVTEVSVSKKTCATPVEKPMAPSKINASDQPYEDITFLPSAQKAQAGLPLRQHYGDHATQEPTAQAMKSSQIAEAKPNSMVDTPLGPYVNDFPRFSNEQLRTQIRDNEAELQSLRRKIILLEAMNDDNDDQPVGVVQHHEHKEMVKMTRFTNHPLLTKHTDHAMKQPSKTHRSTKNITERSGDIENSKAKPPGNSAIMSGCDAIALATQQNHEARAQEQQTLLNVTEAEKEIQQAQVDEEIANLIARPGRIEHAAVPSFGANDILGRLGIGRQRKK